MNAAFRSTRLLAACFLTAYISGCASKSAPPLLQEDLSRINREQAATLLSLNKEVLRLNDEIQRLLQASFAELEPMKKKLDLNLRAPAQAGDLAISMQSKGLVIAVLDRALFTPGKWELKTSAEEILRAIAQVLNAEAVEHRIYVEGHTDNQPTRRSSWRSNWELSTARAAEVLHFLVEQAEVNPKRVAAVGYGEFQSAASNETPEGRMKNRRVEIVISSQKTGDM